MKSFGQLTRLLLAGALLVGALLVGALLVGVPAAMAEDDLLSILGGGGATSLKLSDPAAPSVLSKLVPKPTTEQAQFMQAFDGGQNEKALLMWSSAFGEDSEFAKSPSGRALHGLLLFKNGLHVTGVESAFTIENPKEIAIEIVKLWQDVAPATHAVWSMITPALWKEAWAEVFGVAVEVKVRGRALYGLNDLEALKTLIRKTLPDTRERGWLEWQLILALSEENQAGMAATLLAHLMKAGSNPVGQDLMTMTAGRLLYQNGFLDAAMKYYREVPKSSDHWIEAQEEIGWAFLRKGEPQNTLAVAKTLENPALKTQVGPEPIFLKALAELKVCDYPAVSRSMTLFRDRFRNRAAFLLSVIEQPVTPETKAFFEAAKLSQIKANDPRPFMAKLPRETHRDEFLRGLIATEKALETEAKRAGEIYARSANVGSQLGLQAPLELIRKGVESRAEAARSASRGRLKEIAEDEVKEVSSILQRMKIVEVEVLQRLSLSDRVIAAASGGEVSVKKGSTGGKGRDTIRFPVEKEVWFDELANYRIDIKKDCQATVTR